MTKFDQQGAAKPVLDFRAHGWPRSEVKEAENGRVRELIHNIESHPSSRRPTRGFEANKRLSTRSAKIQRR